MFQCSKHLSILMLRIFSVSKHSSILIPVMFSVFKAFTNINDMNILLFTLKKNN